MKTSAPSSGVSPESPGAPDATTEEERWLRCGSCGARIVREAARLVVNGAHEHSFVNPAGLRFVVGCWSSAPGCVGEGERSTVWTWFPGFCWQLELCRACGAHLGWSFHGRAGEGTGAASFYGLVRDRLA